MPLTNQEKRRLKEQAHHLETVVRVGKGGLSASVLASVEQALRARELIKVRLDHERDERDVLAREVAEATGAELIWQVGKVAVFYRPKTA
ncbi:MAG: YhbY family RNA-binding protein [Verrucomicrobia bacterium]|nr:YhbY family RNA-binding protein [Verrucomicrobiota bacterium]